MSTADTAWCILRAIESLRDAEVCLNRVIHHAIEGPARSRAREAGADIERAQRELMLAFRELQRIERSGSPTAPEAA